MVTIAAALLAIGYTLFYVAGSNLAHGPGKGVGLTEALGFGAPTSPSSPATPAGAVTGAAASPGKPKPGSSTTVNVPTNKAQLDTLTGKLASGGHP